MHWRINIFLWGLERRGRSCILSRIPLSSKFVVNVDNCTGAKHCVEWDSVDVYHYCIAMSDFITIYWIIWTHKNRVRISLKKFSNISNYYIPCITRTTILVIIFLLFFKLSFKMMWSFWFIVTLLPSKAELLVNIQLDFLLLSFHFCKT